MLSEPNISYKPFWGICRPLNSWRANSPNPIQIYCAANRQDRHDKAVALAKKGGAVASVVVVPALQVVNKKGGALVKEVAGKGMDVVINVVKKKIQ